LALLQINGPVLNALHPPLQRLLDILEGLSGLRIEVAGERGSANDSGNR
jgi:hypothetical protein